MLAPDRPQPDAPERPITVPLLTRGGLDDVLIVSVFAVAILGMPLVPLYYVALHGEREALVGAAVFSCGTVGAGFVAFCRGLMLVQRREQVQLTATGFLLSRGERSRAFSDEQVVGVAHQIGGFFGGDQNRRLLTVGGASQERIECRYTVHARAADPLAGFVSRLVGGLAARIDRDLEKGAELVGDGWSLDAKGLHVRGKSYPLEAVTALGVYDRHLCLWLADEERPFLRLPQGSRNVLPLGEILRRRSQGRPDSNVSPDGLSLGRLLLERRYWDLQVRLRGAGFLGLFGLCGVFVVVPVLAVERETRGASAIVALAILAGGVVVASWIAFSAWLERPRWVRFHERGAVQTGAVEASLRYDEVGEVTWGQSLILEPLPGLGRRAIVFRLHTWEHEADLASIRDVACRPLARRWREALERGPVEWTERLWFRADGLEFMAEKSPLVEPHETPPVEQWGIVPYEDLSYRLEHGWFWLFVRGHERRLCLEDMRGRNFFVGLLLLEWLRQGRGPLPSGGDEHAPRLITAGDERVTPGPAEGVRPEPGKGPRADSASGG
jgi:hypothetical protein